MSTSTASGARCVLTASRSSRRRSSVGELVHPEPGPLGVAPSGADGRVGDEPDLHLGVGDDDDADVASLDHGVARAPELALAPRITSRTSGCRATTGTAASISGSRIALVTSSPAIETAPVVAEADRIRARERLERGPSSSGTPSWSASHVSARYIAPVSR